VITLQHPVFFDWFGLLTSGLPVFFFDLTLSHRHQDQAQKSKAKAEKTEKDLEEAEALLKKFPGQKPAPSSPQNKPRAFLQGKSDRRSQVAGGLTGIGVTVSHAGDAALVKKEINHHHVIPVSEEEEMLKKELLREQIGEARARREREEAQTQLLRMQLARESNSSVPSVVMTAYSDSHSVSTSSSSSDEIVM